MSSIVGEGTAGEGANTVYPAVATVKSYDIVEDIRAGFPLIKKLMPFMDSRFAADRNDHVLPDFPERFMHHARYDQDKRLHFAFLIHGRYNDRTSGVTIATLEQMRLHGEEIPWVCLDKVVSYPPHNGIMGDMVGLSKGRKINGRSPVYMGLRTSSLRAHEAYKTVSDVNNEEWKGPHEYYCHGFNLHHDRDAQIFAAMCAYLQKRPHTVGPKR